MSVPDTLRRAADIIGERGHAKAFDVHPDGTGVCANGAIRLALGHVLYENEENGVFMSPPLLWENKNFADFRRDMNLTHDALSHFMVKHGYTRNTGNHMRPAIIGWNDLVAQNGGEVQALLRAAADYIESHIDAEISAAVQTVNDTEKELVNA